MFENEKIKTNKHVGQRLTQDLQNLDKVTQDTPRTPGAQEMVNLVRRLSLWAETASSIDLDDLRADRNTPEASRYGSTAASLVASDNGSRALSYLDAITGPNVYGQKLAATTDPETLQGLHTVLHSGGLDRTDSGKRLTPGEWRTSPSGVPDARTGKTHPAPDPEALPALMRQWSQAFHPDAWQGVHSVVYAAQAHASLVAIRPFEDGNGRVARMVAGKIMRDNGYPAADMSAMNERHRAPINARLFDAIANNDIAGWTRAFTGLSTEGTDAVNQQIPKMRQDVIKLAANMGQKSGFAHESRHAIAVSMMANPINRPVAFAQRNGLDHTQTTELLRPLARKGLVEMGRINGKQVILTHPGIESARALARPQASHLQENTRASLRATPSNKDDPER